MRRFWRGAGLNWGMKMTEQDDLGGFRLDSFFAEARDAAPEPGAALLARVFEDAQAQSALRTAVAAGPVAEPLAPSRQTAATAATAARGGATGRAALRAVLRTVLGGWGAAGGLATATVAGLWIGFAGAGNAFVQEALGISVQVAVVQQTPLSVDSDILVLASE